MVISRRAISHPRVMAELDQLTRPMMGRTAGFHPDKTLGQLREEAQHDLALQRLGHNHAANGVDRMNLKDMLG
jgi:hypothetical protein